MVLLVMHHLKNGSHGLDRNRFLLGTSHGDLAVPNTIGLHEWYKGLGDVFVDKCADAR